MNDRLDSVDAPRQTDTGRSLRLVFRWLIRTTWGEMRADGDFAWVQRLAVSGGPGDTCAFEHMQEHFR